MIKKYTPAQWTIEYGHTQKDTGLTYFHIDSGHYYTVCCNQFCCAEQAEALGEKTCIAVVKIVIDRERIWCFPERRSEAKPLPITNRRLHEMEGFMNVLQMMDFFDDHYGLPFTGYWHVWRSNDAEDVEGFMTARERYRKSKD